jgi:retron-type reverse transcriptase
VQQGSIISPILFSYYINDLLTQAEQQQLGILAYADDVVIYSDICNLDGAIELVKKWS